MRVALVHDWLTGMRGGERVLEALVALFPEATLFTLVHQPGRLTPSIETRPIRTSFIQRLPLAPRRFRHYLPLFPTAIERFDLAGFDLAISTSHCVALGIRTPPETCHIGYCFTPMRYAWDLREEYLGVSGVGRLVLPPLLDRLQRWDREAARRPDFLACISHHVAGRIRLHWEREARVIYPPLRTDHFVPDGRPPDDFFLIVSAFAPYKRLDVAIEAFNRLRWPLRIIGDGAAAARLRRLAGPTITFLGWQEDRVLAEQYARCRAFVFPGVEEFGIAPLEAMAAGRPVIGYARGALLETSLEGVTGLFFQEQTPESLIDALRRFELTGFDADKIRAHALRFREERFIEEMAAYVAECLERHRRGLGVTRC